MANAFSDEEIEALLPYAATPVQIKRLKAYKQYGSAKAAANAEGVSRNAVAQSISQVRSIAARQGYSPDHDMVHTVPAGFAVKGVSTLYDKDGIPSAQWVKSTADKEQQFEIMKGVVDSLAADMERLPLIEPPKHTLNDLINVYTMTDCHMGMLAWHKEGGADWDVKIAKRTLVKCFERMVSAAQPASHCVVSQLGDFLHSDGILPVTPTSGHVLDQDGRFSKIVEATIDVLRHLVDFALQRHDTVHVIMAEGNHDITSSIWLRSMFKALYANEPRVTINGSEVPYYVHQFGDVMLGWSHGHKLRKGALPLFFATEYSKIWGATTKRYIHTGHMHHRDEKEHSGVTVIQHSTLAARDAHASRGGYHSERQARAITYHKEQGEVGSIVVTPEMVGE